MSVVDRDYGWHSEDDTEHPSTGFCQGWCGGENQALPDEDLCRDCFAEIAPDLEPMDTE